MVQVNRRLLVSLRTIKLLRDPNRLFSLEILQNLIGLLLVFFLDTALSSDNNVVVEIGGMEDLLALDAFHAGGSIDDLLARL